MLSKMYDAENSHTYLFLIRVSIFVRKLADQAASNPAAFRTGTGGGFAARPKAVTAAIAALQTQLPINPANPAASNTYP